MAPLSERMRPTKLEELAGQQHLVGKGSILRTAIENGNIPSMIFWGPPGSGKTTIANIIAHTLNVPFHQLSAISSGVKDVREVIEKAKQDIKEYKAFEEALEKDGLINKKENYSIEHKDGQLIINGKVQPQAVYNKYRSFLENHKQFKWKKDEDGLDLNND